MHTNILPNIYAVLNQYYLLYFFICCIAFLLIIFIYFYIDLLNTSAKVKNAPQLLAKEIQEAKEIKDSAYAEALRIVDQARAHSLRILMDSQSKSKEVLNDVKDLNDSTKKDIYRKLMSMYEKQADLLKGMGEDLLLSYKQAIENEKNENIRTLNETSVVLRKEVISEVESFKDTLKKGTLEVQKELEARLQKSYEEVDKEIRAYKTSKINALNNKIFEILATITVQVIGRNLDQHDSEKYVLEALNEELRKSGFQSNTLNNVSNKDSL